MPLPLVTDVDEPAPVKPPPAPAAVISAPLVISCEGQKKLDLVIALISNLQSLLLTKADLANQMIQIRSMMTDLLTSSTLVGSIGSAVSNHVGNWLMSSGSSLVASTFSVAENTLANFSVGAVQGAWNALFGDKGPEKTLEVVTQISKQVDIIAARSGADQAAISSFTTIAEQYRQMYVQLGEFMATVKSLETTIMGITQGSQPPAFGDLGDILTSAASATGINSGQDQQTWGESAPNNPNAPTADTNKSKIPEIGPYLNVNSVTVLNGIPMGIPFYSYRLAADGKTKIRRQLYYIKRYKINSLPRNYPRSKRKNK